MSLRQPWFLVMVPKAAASRKDFWVGYGAKLPAGMSMARLITPEDWTLLAAFVVAWVVAASLIWIWGFGSGAFSLAFAVLATVLVGRRRGRELRPPDLRPDDRAADRSTKQSQSR